jgi:hypothetical protein
MRRLWMNWSPPTSRARGARPGVVVRVCESTPASEAVRGGWPKTASGTTRERVPTFKVRLGRRRRAGLPVCSVPIAGGDKPWCGQACRTGTESMHVATC